MSSVFENVQFKDNTGNYVDDTVPIEAFIAMNNLINAYHIDIDDLYQFKVIIDAIRNNTINNDGNDTEEEDDYEQPRALKRSYAEFFTPTTERTQQIEPRTPKKTKKTITCESVIPIRLNFDSDSE